MHIYVIDIIKQCYSDICALKFSKMNSTEFSAIFLCLFAVVVQISGYDRKCTKWEIAFGCNPKVCIRNFFSFFAYPNTSSRPYSYALHLFIDYLILTYENKYFK